MRRAIVHVGFPRTGTTTVQRILSDHRAALRGVGILYPNLTPHTAAEPHLSHQHLGEALDGRRPARDRAALLADLAAQLRATDCDTVVLSYERLCLTPAVLGVPALLRQIFAESGFTMQVLATTKPQGEYLNSTYTWRTQFLREHRDFDRFFRASIGNRQLDFAHLLRQWQHEADHRMAIVPLYAPGSGASLVERFLAAAGIAGRTEGVITPADLSLVENRSPGPLAVEASRRLRLGGAHLALGPAAREATRFVEQASRARGFDDLPFWGLDPRHLQDAEHRWARSNTRLLAMAEGSPDPPIARRAPQPVNELARSMGSDEIRSHLEDVLAQTTKAFQIRLRRGRRLLLPGIADTAWRQFGRARHNARALAARLFPPRDG